MVKLFVLDIAITASFAFCFVKY